VIVLRTVTEQQIWHELAHAISFGNKRIPQDAYWFIADGLATFFPSDYKIDDFCFRAYCHREYGLLSFYTGKHPEYWADGFAAWVYIKTYRATPDSWIRNGYQPNWAAIYFAVEYSLTVTFIN
jgi:hypothetical protein